jgi:hypothetical protein
MKSSKVSGKMVKKMDSESGNLQKETIIKVCGKITDNLEKDSTNTMDQFIKVNLLIF